MCREHVPKRITRRIKHAIEITTHTDTDRCACTQRKEISHNMQPVSSPADVFDDVDETQTSKLHATRAFGSLGIICSTPGAESRHEISLVFNSCFREGCPAKHAPPELFGRLCGLLTGAHFVDKLGSHAGSIANSAETGAKLKTTLPGARF